MNRSITNFKWFILLLLLAISTSAFAQIQNVQIGDRVRITTTSVENDFIIGTIARNTPYAISLSYEDSTLTITNSSIQQIAVSQGRRGNARKGAWIGSISGATIMTIYTTKYCDRNGGSLFHCIDSLLAGAAIGGLPGYGIGALIGAIIKTEHWEEVPISVSMGLSPSYGEFFSVNPGISVRLSIK